MAKSSVVCISYRWLLGGRTSSRNRYIDNPHQFVCWIVFSPLLSGAVFDSHARYDVSTPNTLLFIDVFPSDILNDMAVLDTETSTCWRGIFFLACKQQRRDCTWYSQRLPAFFVVVFIRLFVIVHCANGRVHQWLGRVERSNVCFES